MRSQPIFCLLSVLAVLSGCKKSNSSDVNLNQGLIAYYPFNGNANDESGNKLNGVIQNGVSFSPDISGKANSAVTFDGSTGYILVTDNAGLLITDAASVSFLVNATDVADRGALVNKVNVNDGTGLSYGVNISSPTSNEEFNFGANRNDFDCASNSYDAGAIVINNGAPIATNQWYHVVAIFSDSVQQLYVNGVLKTSTTRDFKTLNKCTSNNYLVIGGWWQSDIISLYGSMDELRIYNRALNQDEITELAKPVTK